MSSEWVTIASFSQPIHAHLARTQLEAEGVTCVMGDEHLVLVDWMLSNAVGGVKLKVPAAEAAYAREVLRPKPRLVVVADPDTPVEPDDPICPVCRSYDVYFQRFDRRIAGLFWLMLGFIVPWRSRRWECLQCGHNWREHPHDDDPAHRSDTVNQ